MRDAASASVALAETDHALDNGVANSREADTDRAPRRRISDERSESRDRWLGRIIDDRYRVLEIIGSGGMGMVYRVEHQRMGKIAAMKVLHPEHSREPDLEERFRREAEAISRLTHPNTVQVFDFGATQDNLYLIMEYVRGRDLSTLIQRDGPLPFARVAPILAQICAALGEAHALGIVHRDLKPENVLVTRTHRGRDFAKILDFGLVKLGARPEPEGRPGREDRAAVTDRGAIIGTPYYMSPEQIRGEEVDARTDIYALGSVMYRMLTGEHAFAAGTPMGVLTKHLTTELVPPSVRAPDRDIAPVLDDIVGRAMAKSPADRYASIGTMLDDIEAAFATLCAGGASSLDIVETASWPAHLAAAHALARDDSDQIDYGMDSALRLRRADLDAYERALRRRRLVRVGTVPVILAGLAGLAAYLVLLRAEAPRDAEREPNDQMDDATLIAPDRPVTGYLGKRISRREADRDYFRVRALPAVPAVPAVPAGYDDDGVVVTAHVTALPNIDIALSLFDPTGKLLARVSEGGMGQDEWIRRLRVNSPVHALVTEAMGEGVRLPTENVSDTYTLTLAFAPVAADRESEPNGGPSDAMALVPGRPVSGHLDQRQDVDCYRFEGTAGAYELRIEGAADVPLQWQLDGRAPGSERQARVELAPGDIVLLRRADGERGEAPLPGADQPYTIGLAPR